MECLLKTQRVLRVECLAGCLAGCTEDNNLISVECLVQEGVGVEEHSISPVVMLMISLKTFLELRIHFKLEVEVEDFQLVS